MKYIYILDVFSSSKRNGIGTFLKQLQICLETTNIHLCLIQFDSDTNDFSIQEDTLIRKILFPPFLKGDFTTNFKVVGWLLQLHIPDSANNIFIFNHFPCDNIFKEVRRSYPLSKLIFIIHDMFWTNLFLGNSNLFAQFLAENKTNNPILLQYNSSRSFYMTTDAIICLSDDTKNTLINTYNIPNNKIHLIPNGMFDCIEGNKVENIRKKLNIDAKEKIILYVGRICKAKGIIELIKSFQDVLVKEPKSRLVIAGTSDYSGEISLYSNEISSRIIITGQITQSELFEWYTIADIGVIPSYTEQCSYVGIEMMMHGVAIVASNGFGVRNMFQNHSNALIANIENYNDNSQYVNNLTQRILKLLSSKYLQTNLKYNSRKTYEHYYNGNQMRENYIKLLEIL